MLEKKHFISGFSDTADATFDFLDGDTGRRRSPEPSPQSRGRWWLIIMIEVETWEQIKLFMVQGM